jgi:hypothetical protein
MVKRTPGENRFPWSISMAGASNEGLLTSLYINFLDVVVEYPSAGPVFRLDIVL